MAIEVVVGQVFSGRRTSLRAGSASQVFGRSRTAFGRQRRWSRAWRPRERRTSLERSVGGRNLAGGSIPSDSAIDSRAALNRGCTWLLRARSRRAGAFVPFVRFGPGTLPGGHRIYLRKRPPQTNRGGRSLGPGWGQRFQTLGTLTGRPPPGATAYPRPAWKGSVEPHAVLLHDGRDTRAVWEFGSYVVTG